MYHLSGDNLLKETVTKNSSVGQSKDESSDLLLKQTVPDNGFSYQSAGDSGTSVQQIITESCSSYQSTAKPSSSNDICDVSNLNQQALENDEPDDISFSTSDDYIPGTDPGSSSSSSEDESITNQKGDLSTVSKIHWKKKHQKETYKMHLTLMTLPRNEKEEEGRKKTNKKRVRNPNKWLWNIRKKAKDEGK